jgi:3-oxoacyl-[acyl-carrier-protein] synthase-3
MRRYATVVSTSAYVPDREITNDALRDRFARTAPEFVDKMEASSGIRTRFWAPDSWATSDLALPAARLALERASLAPEDVDLVVVGTDSPDYVTPSTSVVLQHKLGAKRAGTYDVGCACASFPTALATAAALMAMQPRLANVLVVGAYMMHRLADPADPMLFFYGDGAGAVVLRTAKEPGVLGATFRADGAFAKHWGIFSGGTAEPASAESVREGRTRVRMIEKYPDHVNEEGWTAIVRALAEDAAFDVGAIDHAIFTQVRARTIERVMGRLSLPIDRAPMTMGKWGYTGSACIPMALDEAVTAGRVREGDLVVMVGSGVGYNQAGVALRVTSSLVGVRSNH